MTFKKNLSKTQNTLSLKGLSANRKPNNKKVWYYKK